MAYCKKTNYTSQINVDSYLLCPLLYLYKLHDTNNLVSPDPCRLIRDVGSLVYFHVCLSNRTTSIANMWKSMRSLSQNQQHELAFISFVLRDTEYSYIILISKALLFKKINSNICLLVKPSNPLIFTHCTKISQTKGMFTLI